MEKKEILLKLRQETGMNRREFAEYFGIPYRTVQEWELGHREMPGYLLRLMYYHEPYETGFVTVRLTQSSPDGVLVSFFVLIMSYKYNFPSASWRTSIFAV